MMSAETLSCEDQRVECAEVPAVMFVAHKRIIILNLFPGQERKYFFLMTCDPNPIAQVFDPSLLYLDLLSLLQGLSLCSGCQSAFCH